MQVTGRSGDILDVMPDGRLMVDLEDPMVKAAQEGRAFVWNSTTQDIDAGDTALFLKNLDDKMIILDRAVINGSNVICEWTFGLGSAVTTPAGTALAARSLNPEFPSVKYSYTAMNDETAVATADTISNVWTTIAGTGDSFATLNLRGFVIPKNHYAQITQVTESTSGSAQIFGYFER